MLCRLHITAGITVNDFETGDKTRPFPRWRFVRKDDVTTLTTTPSGGKKGKLYGLGGSVPQRLSFRPEKTHWRRHELPFCGEKEMSLRTLPGADCVTAVTSPSFNLQLALRHAVAFAVVGGENRWRPWNSTAFLTTRNEIDFPKKNGIRFQFGWLFFFNFLYVFVFFFFGCGSSFFLSAEKVNLMCRKEGRSQVGVAFKNSKRIRWNWTGKIRRWLNVRDRTPTGRPKRKLHPSK